MGVPESPQTLTPEKLDDLNQKLSDARHNINNSLSLIVAAVELIRCKPDTAQRMAEKIGGQPEKILNELKQFSQAFETALGITRD